MSMNYVQTITFGYSCPEFADKVGKLPHMSEIGGVMV